MSAVGNRDQVRSGDLVGELAVELGRGERVVSSADHQGALADVPQPVGRIVLHAGVTLPHEQARGEGSAVAREELHHRVDQIGLLERLLLERPQQPLPDHHLEGSSGLGQIAQLPEQQPPFRVRPRVGPDQ